MIGLGFRGNDTLFRPLFGPGVGWSIHDCSANMKTLYVKICLPLMQTGSSVTRSHLVIVQL